MNREEYYRKRRIYRAVISSIKRNHLRMDEEEAKEVWDIFWEGIYNRMPSKIYETLVGLPRFYGSPWDLTRSGMKCNISKCPNSWPHKTRNP